MRVLHVQKVTGVGGSERHLLDLLWQLPSAGCRPRMCVLEAEHADRFVSELGDRRIEHVRLHAGPDANPLVVWRLRREVLRWEAELVHTHLIHADLHGQLAARLASTPAISSMHSVHGFFLREPYRSAVRLAFRSARRVIAISGFVAEFLEQHRLAPRERIRVVPYGIDADAWRSTAGDRDEARRSFGVGEGDFVVGMASRLVPGKGHVIAFDAVRRASATHPRVRMLVAGTGPSARPLLASARGAPVVFLGFVHDVRAFMAACDTVVVPTEPWLGEGFGLAALEAMAAERPVIVSRVASLPEVVGPDGLTFTANDSEALAGLVERLADDADEAHERATAGARHARSRYSLGSMVGSTVEVYRDALRGR